MIYKFDKETLNYKRVTGKIALIIFAVGCLVSGLMALLTINKINDVKYLSQETKSIILKERDEFTEEKLKAYIIELNIRYPHIVMAQAIIESGNFKSQIFRDNNNIFGMKVATKRPTTNKGEENGHAYFNSWKESVVDYAFYSAQYLSDIRSEKEYLEYLRQNYAKDTAYVNKILRIIKK
jgi:flagellum-specific peptidoglycan hydrolase FlgJ